MPAHTSPARRHGNLDNPPGRWGPMDPGRASPAERLRRRGADVAAWFDARLERALSGLEVRQRARPPVTWGLPRIGLRGAVDPARLRANLVHAVQTGAWLVGRAWFHAWALLWLVTTLGQVNLYTGKVGGVWARRR